MPIYLSDRRALAMLKIGDKPPAPVVFDTGTSGNSLDTDYAAAMALETDPSVRAQVVDGTTGKMFVATAAILSNATLGEVAITGNRANVYPYKERDVVGIFGPNSFKGKLLLLDLGAARLIVIDPKKRDAPRDAISYIRTAGGKDGLPAIRVDLPGITVPALLDSGNDSPLLLPRSLADKLPLTGPLRHTGTLSSVTGEQDEYTGTIKGNVRIGSVVLKNPTVTFAGIHANVGLPVIRKLRIMLDPAQQVAWVFKEPVLNAVKAGAYAGRYGVRRVRQSGASLVYQRNGRSPYQLHYLGEDLFSLEDTGNLVQFWRDGDRVAGFDLIGADGEVSCAKRGNSDC